MSSAPPLKTDWGLLAILVLLFALPNYAWFFDAIFYANHALYGPWDVRLHPHHLGFATFVWALGACLAGVGLPVKSIYLMIILARLGGLATALQLRAFAHDLGLGPRWVFALPLVFAASYTTWNYATNGAVYLMSVACLLPCVREVHRWTDERPTERQWLQATAWFTAAFLLHQLAILGWAGLLLARGLRTRSLQGVMPLLLMLLPLSALYLGAAVVVLGRFDVGAMFHWLTGYGHTDEYWIWNVVPEGATLVGTWLATLRDAHTHLLVSFGDPLVSIAPVWIQVLGTLLLPVVIVWGFRTLRQHWQTHPEDRDTIRLLCCWALPYFLFSSFFEVRNAHYRLHYYWALLLLGALPLARGLPRPLPRWVTPGAILLAVLFSAANLWTAWTYSWVEYNPNLSALPSIRALPPGPLALDADFYGERNDYNYLKQLLDGVPHGERMVYRVDFFTAAEVAPVPGETFTLPEVIRTDHAALAAEHDRLYLDGSTVAYYRMNSKHGPFDARYLRLRREGSATRWLDLAQLTVLGDVRLGPYGFVVYGLR